MSRFLVYGLVDPRNGEVRYVGKSVRGIGRAKHHAMPWSLRKNARLPVVAWIKKLNNLGLSYSVIVLEELPRGEDTGNAEIAHIRRLRDEGCRLLNVTDGGEGGLLGTHHSDATRKKMSVSLLSGNKTNGPKNRAAVSAALMGNTFSRGRRYSSEIRIKMSQGMGGTPIIDQNGTRYETQAEACRALGISSGNLSVALSGRNNRHSAGGYRFTRVTLS